MMSSSEEPTASQPTSAPQNATPPKRGRAGGTQVHGKPSKNAPKLPAAKNPAKGRKKAVSACRGSKTARILQLLKRPGGITLKELTKATGWQPHSVRGFLSGVLGKKMRLKIRSARDESGERHYSISS